MLTYKKPNPHTGIKTVYEYVYLGGRKIGSIKKTIEGYEYFPVGSKDGGGIFKTIQECKDSLK